MPRTPTMSQEEYKARQREAKAKYDRANTRQYALKLHYTNDADIIEMLDSQENIQGYIKTCIRLDIAKHKKP